MNSPRLSCVRLLALCSLLGLGAGRLLGGDLGGQVTDARTRAPLPGAEVTLLPSGRTVAADPGGRFSFADLPAGNYTLQVRYLGFEPRVEPVAVPAAGAGTVNIALGSEVVQLSAVTVEGYREGRARALQQEMRGADEVFICSTAGGIMPVRAVDDQAIGDGSPGPTTQRLAALYWSKRESGWHGTAIDSTPAEAGTTDTQQGKR